MYRIHSPPKRCGVTPQEFWGEIDFTIKTIQRTTQLKENDMSNKKNYGCMNFIIDAVLTLITSGLWLIWIFVREMRK